MIIKRIYSKLLTSVLGLGLVTSLSAETAVERHGKLRTEGPYLLNEHGRIVQLRGMSFYWSTPEWPGAGFYTKEWVDYLADQWKCTVVRAAYDRDNGNDKGWDQVKTVVDAAIAKGIYVIIDWHSHTAHDQQSAAVSFFSQKAEFYKNTPNVIFEPYNEPKWAGGAEAMVGDQKNAAKTWTAIKPYLKAVTKAIRSTGSENLVILGTPYFAQHVGIAADAPVLDDNNQPFKNVAYAFHFYAASHGPNAYYVKNGDGSGGMESSYLSAGLGKVPIFITEWGTTHSDGGQEEGHTYIDGTNTEWWFKTYINGMYHLSHCNWSVSGFQPSSAFQGDSKTPSASGTIAKKWISTDVPDNFPLPADTGLDGTALDTLIKMPATHSAAFYNRYYGSGVDTLIVPYGSKRDKDDPRDTKNTALEISTRSDSGWIAYNINSSQETKYIHLRYRAQNGSGTIQFSLNKKQTGEKITIQNGTTWQYATAQVTVPAGKQTLYIYVNNTKDDGYYLEWFELSNTRDIVNIIKSQYQQNDYSIKLLKHNKGYNFILPVQHDFNSYSLLSADGRVINNGNISRNATELNFENISNGVYFLKVVNSNNLNQMLRFVIGN